jgi:death-on-curing protein
MVDPQPVIYLTVGEVERFHEQIMLRAGQSAALLHGHGLLERAVLRPQTAAYYEGADLVTQAALHIVGIALNHAFFDGNKRTRYISGMTFLRLNGVTQRDPRLNDPELGAWLEQVVGHQLDFAAFVERLRERIAQFSAP